MSCLTVTPRTTAGHALEIAVGYAAAHVHEEGGNNRGDQVEFYQKLMGGSPGDPWCADFVCTCLTKGYARALGLAEDRAQLAGYVSRMAGLLHFKLSGYCPALADSARERYLFRSSAFVPLPGDLVLFDFTGRGEPHHVGFVRHVTREGLVTVEGNTSSGEAGGYPRGEWDGGGVYQRSRLREHVFGFVHFG